MTAFAGPLDSGLEGKPAIALWLVGGAVVLALHAAVALGLNRLTPDIPPVERNPALTVELAPFTIPAVVEQDHQLLSGSATPGDVLAPVRQLQSMAGSPLPRVRPVATPRTVAEAIAAAEPAAPAASDAASISPAPPDKAALVKQMPAATESTPDRMQPVDGPMDVAEAITAAGTDPLTALDRGSSVALSQPDAPALAREPTGSIVRARPVTPPIADRRPLDTILSGAVVPDPAASPIAAAPIEAFDPDSPTMPEIAALVPAPRPKPDAAERRTLAAARAAAGKAAAAKAALAREARQKAAQATAAARQPAIAKPSTSKPSTSQTTPQSPAPATTPADRQVATAGGTAPADPASWQRRISAIVNGRKSCPAGGKIASGNVQIRLSVDASGRIGAARIARSSGNPVLDRAALDAARRGSPLPQPPGGRALSVGISIRFSGC